MASFASLGCSRGAGMRYGWGRAPAALCALLVAACGKGETPIQQTNTVIDASKISLLYVCGNQFRVLNSNAQAVPVTWSVQNSGDQGALTLPPPPSSQHWSETVFVTRAIGTVVL